MAEIVSFGDHQIKTNPFKLAWMELRRLSLFTKLTIIILLLVPLVAIKSSTEIFQIYNKAAPPPSVEVGDILPPNCHLAVDYTQCENKKNCEPKPQVACDNK